MGGSDFSRSAESDVAAAPPTKGRWLVWPWIVLLVAVAMLLAYLIQLPSGSADSGDKHPAVGTRIAELRLEPLTGADPAKTADDLQGKVTLINFWGTWCPPCRMEFPHLVEIEQHFRDDKRFQLLSISCSGQSGSDEDIGPETAEFLAAFKATFPTYRDPHQKFLQYLLKVAKLDSFVFPTSVVVDQEGRIRGMWQGYTPGDEREIHRVLETTLRASR